MDYFCRRFNHRLPVHLQPVEERRPPLHPNKLPQLPDQSRHRRRLLDNMFGSCQDEHNNPQGQLQRGEADLRGSQLHNFQVQIRKV
jgi:hypothetical protein